jgi:hypothetical protein
LPNEKSSILLYFLSLSVRYLQLTSFILLGLSKWIINKIKEFHFIKGTVDIERALETKFKKKIKLATSKESKESEELIICLFTKEKI